jgi:hypothetical protein
MLTAWSPPTPASPAASAALSWTACPVDPATADALNAAGHRSGEGKPFTGRIVLELRRSHHLPGHADRLRARGLLTPGEIAGQLGVHTSTIKAWRRAGLLTAHKANDKNIPLFDPPAPGWSNAKAASSPSEFSPRHLVLEHDRGSPCWPPQGLARPGRRVPSPESGCPPATL